MSAMRGLFRSRAVPDEEIGAIAQDASIYARWDGGETEQDAHIEQEYRGYIARKIAFMIVFAVLSFIAGGLVITYGDYPLDFFEVYGIIWDHILHGPPEDPIDFLKDHVVWSLRLPRVLVALIAGFGFAVAGAVMQSTLKNPMADSYTTGVSSGAAFGATVSIVAGFTLFGSGVGILVNAFVFSLVPTFLIVVVSRMRNMSSTSMILAGLAVMYIFNALTSALKLIADPDALASLYRWQVGSLNNMLWADVPVMLAVTAAGSIAIMFLSRRINLLASGDESAKSLGVDANRLRIVCLVTVSLITASIVSFTGTIGFVGLVSPHIARIFIGSDNRYLIPASAFFGAFLLLISDFIGRAAFAPTVLEVGVVTAFIGGPLFLYLIIRQRKEVWT